MHYGVPTHARGHGDAPLWLRVVLPVVVYPVVVVSAVWFPGVYDALQRKEGGIEWVAVLVLLIGLGYGLAMLLRHRSALPRRWLTGWFALSCAGVFVLAGEEISWGQHLGFWEGEDLPELMQRINDQQESNLHNLTNALDQGPTNVVVVMTLFAFFGLPLIQRYKRETMGVGNPGYWFWPSPGLLPAAIGVLVIPFPGRIYEWVSGSEAPNVLRHSEVHEFYIALLMAGYLASVCRRAKSIDAGGAGASREPAVASS